MKLIDSGVVFNSETHQYFLDGKELCGVTKMIKNQITPGKYDNIQEDVLQKAAQKGSLIHGYCEVYDNFGEIEDDYHVRDYIRITSPFRHIISEYIVTDRTNFATPIDKVFAGEADNEFIIGDIKTTSSFDKKSTSWQCSICAYLFERQNPGAKVSRLIGIWLPDEKYQSSTKKPCIFELYRHPDEEVKRLLDVEVNGGKFLENSISRPERGNSLVKVDNNVPAQIANMEGYIIDVLKREEEIAKEKEVMIKKLHDAMIAFNITKLSTENFTFSITATSTKKSFNRDAAKSKYPDIDWDDDALYNVSNVKGSIKVYKKS